MKRVEERKRRRGGIYTESEVEVRKEGTDQARTVNDPSEGRKSRYSTSREESSKRTHVHIEISNGGMELGFHGPMQ